MNTDELALCRTELANERTWLAYVRTALTLLVAGVSFLQFFASPVIRALGWAFLPTGLTTLAFGYMRFQRTKRVLDLASGRRRSQNNR